MNIANCPSCGKVYMKNPQGMCANCLREIEEQFLKCSKYLRDNRGTTLVELSEATSVSIRQITKFIREGRISIANTPNMSYACETCGEPIREGTICENCRGKLAREVGHLYEDEKRKKEQQASKPTYMTFDRSKEN